MKRIAINGLGRIGRALLRAHHQQGKENLLPVAVNDPAPSEHLALLLARDSLHGRAQMPVALQESGQLQVGANSLHLSHFTEAVELPWQELGVDLVLDCSGTVPDRVAAKQHLKAGAQKVLLSHPGTGDWDATVVYGVNQGILSGKEQLISAASCTSNCLVPVLSVLDEVFGVEHGASTTLHAAMNDQPLLDTPTGATARLTRAAGRSAVPVPTRLAEGVGRILPQLAGRMISHSLRIPGVSVSAIDLKVQLQTPASPNDIHAALKNASEQSLAGVLGLCDEPLVSEDFLGDARSVIVDTTETDTMDNGMARLLLWFDNEWAFACRMLDLAEHWLAC